MAPASTANAVLFAAVCTAAGTLAFGPNDGPNVPIAPGVVLPMVVLGTGSGQKGDVTSAVSLWLGQAGGVGLDCAYDYQNEGEVAKGIAASGKARGGAFIETKIPCGSYRQATKDIASNLEQLNVGQVDLTLIHSQQCGWDSADGGGASSSVAETWRALEDALAAGKTKAIGVSHFAQKDIEKLMETAKIKPAVNQCELSVSFHDDATIKYCQSQGITYQSFSPLCGGFNGSSCSMRGGKNVMTIPLVQQVAATHNVSAAQIGLKWIVQQGLPLATAVWKLDYMNEDLDLWSWGNLSAKEMTQLSAVAPSA